MGSVPFTWLEKTTESRTYFFSLWFVLIPGWRDTLLETNIAPENRPLEKDIGKGDSNWKSQFLGAMLVWGSVELDFTSSPESGWRRIETCLDKPRDYQWKEWWWYLGYKQYSISEYMIYCVCSPLPRMPVRNEGNEGFALDPLLNM